MTYQLYQFPVEGLANATVKLAQNSFEKKTVHNGAGQEIISKKRNEIALSGCGSNDEKVIIYFTRDETGETLFKVVSEDYASFLAAVELNHKINSGEKVEGYLRPHFAAGAIAVCKTSDDKIIIGSRDASRDRIDYFAYPLQFPCGFIDVNQKFYDEIKYNNPELLNQDIIDNARRELFEEILHFSDNKILRSNLVAAIYEEKKWRRKTEQGDDFKNVNVVKSFIVEFDVSLTFDEILQRRNTEIAELYQKLQRDDLSEIEREDLLCRKKDFDEMTVLGFIEEKEIVTLLAKHGSGFNVGINFDGRMRRFVAEHGLVLDVIGV